MGKNQLKKKNKFRLLLESEFDVNLFYKPTMQNDDIFYYIELDNLIRIVCKIVSDNVVIISEVTPLTTTYIQKKYDKLISLLMNQKDFTIIISCIGNVNCLIDSCKANNLPFIDNSRFISTNVRVYDHFKSIYKDNVFKYGVCIVSVSENTAMEEEPKPKVEVKPVPKVVVDKDSIELPEYITDNVKEFSLYIYKYTSIKFNISELNPNTKDRFLASNANKFYFTFGSYGDMIVIYSISMSSTCSSLDILSFINYLEKFKSNRVLLQGNNYIVSGILQVKGYRMTNAFGSNSLNYSYIVNPEV